MLPASDTPSGLFSSISTFSELEGGLIHHRVGVTVLYSLGSRCAVCTV